MYKYKLVKFQLREGAITIQTRKTLMMINRDKARAERKHPDRVYTVVRRIETTQVIEALVKGRRPRRVK